jgi:iron complex transport system substrate-binding protein
VAVADLALADGTGADGTARGTRCLVGRGWVWGLAASLLLGAAGCDGPGSPNGSPDGTARDTAGLRSAERSLPVPERVISLIPAVTSLLVELELGDRLVGRTDFDTLASLASLPSVGGGIGPSLERLLELRPDLVIRFAGPSDAMTGERLAEAGIPQVAVRTDLIGDFLAIVLEMGTRLGAEAQAAALHARIEGELAAVRNDVAGRPRPRVVYLLGGDPPLVASGGTFIHELVVIAGGVNLVEDVGPLYAPISVEEILRRAPDLIVASEGSRIPAGLREIPLRTVPSWVEVPGPHLGRAARLLAETLHPPEAP